MSKPVLLTIILNYRTAEMTLRAAQSALVATTGLSGEIIIVDNDSQDGSFEKIAKHICDAGWDSDNRVRAIQSPRNGGFGAGNNFGIAAGMSDGSLPDYIYILNSDAFPETDAIGRLLDHMEDNPKTGIAGSFILGEDDETHLTTFRFPTIFSEFEGSIKFGPVSRLLRKYTVPVKTPETTCPVDWLAGASMMLRYNMLEEIGLFDEKFFLYFEETDLCRRAGKAGYFTVFVPESRVVHVGSASTGMKEWKQVPSYWFDSRQYYFAKNHGKIYGTVATLAHLIGGTLHWLRCVISGNSRSKGWRFLANLATHDAKALLRPVPESNRATVHQENSSIGG